MLLNVSYSNWMVMPRLFSKPVNPVKRPRHVVGLGYGKHKHGTLFGIKMANEHVLGKPMQKIAGDHGPQIGSPGLSQFQQGFDDKKVFGGFAPFIGWFRDNVVPYFSGGAPAVNKVLEGLTFLANELMPGVSEITEGVNTGNAGKVVEGLAYGLLAEFGPGLFLKAMRSGRVALIGGRRYFRTLGKVFAKGPGHTWKVIVEGVPRRAPRFLPNYFGRKNAARAIQSAFRNSKGGRLVSAVSEDIRLARLRDYPGSASRLKSKVFRTLKGRRGTEYKSFYNLSKEDEQINRVLHGGRVHYGGDMFFDPVGGGVERPLNPSELRKRIRS